MKRIGIYILIGLIIIIGLKSCIMTVISFDNYILIERTDENGQKDRVLFTPKNEMIYVKKYQELVKYGIYKVKGKEATHYISGIYCIGTFPIGLRFYKNAEKVYDAQLILSNKNGDSFPSVGESFNSTIIIFPNKVKIGKFLFNRLSPTESEIAIFENMIIQLKSL